MVVLIVRIPSVSNTVVILLLLVASAVVILHMSVEVEVLTVSVTERELVLGEVAPEVTVYV